MDRRCWQGRIRWCKRRLAALWLACLLGCLIAPSVHAQLDADEPFPATLEDYGLLAEGLVALSAACGDTTYAQWALDLAAGLSLLGIDAPARM